MTVSANRPATEVVDQLKQVIEESGTIPAVGKGIRLLGSGGSTRRGTLEDFTFAQDRMVICPEANWLRFEAVVDTMGELVNADFAEINELRNVAFHFRRRFRDRLRYDRELYGRERRAGAAAS